MAKIYVESKVPKDLRQYKSTVFGTFTLRQGICIALCVIVDLYLITKIIPLLALPVNVAVYLTILVDLPILAFTIEPHGVKMEVYLKYVVLKRFTWKRFRKYNTSLDDHTFEITKVQKKQRSKELPNLIKEHPNLRMYR